MPKLLYGDSAARKVSERIAEPQASLTALKSIPANKRVDNMRAVVTSDGSRWRFHGTSVLTGDDVLVAAPSAGSGVWLRECSGVKLTLPFTFATADATALLTLQAGQKLLIQEIWWEVTVDFSGGASSTIGVSSNKTNFSTKGDLLGGAAGSLAAALTAAGTPNFGTIGAGFDTLAKRRIVFKATDTIRHDRITSAFTTGTGSVCIAATILENAGA